MKRPNVCLFAAFFLCCVLAAAPAENTLRIGTSGPLRFEPVDGANSRRYIASGMRYRLLFEADEAVCRTRDGIVRLQFVNANPTSRVEPLDLLPSKTSRFTGNDASRWRTGVANYGRLRVQELYPGVDLLYYGTSDALEYDVKVKAGADPSQVRLRFAGDHPRIDKNGNLVGSFIQKRPLVFQIAANGSRKLIQGSYRRHSDGTFGITLGAYDPARELVIDPVLTLSAYVGGSADDTARAIGHDKAGFLYVAGMTYSTDLTLFGDSDQTTSGGAWDVFVARIDPHAPVGQNVVYTTYYGGSGSETLNDMVVSPIGIVWVAGTTSSTNLPLATPYQSTLAGGTDAFVAAFDTFQSGSAGLVYASYLGGTGADAANGIALDGSGRVYLTGSTSSTDFPTVNAYQGGSAGGQEIFISAIDPKTNTLFYSTYLGGGSWDVGRSIAVDAIGEIWVVGGTYSSDFPLLGNAFQSTYNTQGDSFLVHLTLERGVIYSSYVGGNGLDEAKKIIADASGRLVVTGYTSSTNFPISSAPIQTAPAGSTDIFVMIWTPVPGGAPQLTYSTYIGGQYGEVPYDVKEDGAGNIYVTGYTTSADFPILGEAIQPNPLGGVSGFALKFNPARAGSDAIDYSSYVTSAGTQIGYGIDLDSAGNMYIAGVTTGAMFDSLNGAPRASAVGTLDGFVFGFSPCVFRLSLDSEQFPTQGGTAKVSLTSSRDCPWTVTSPVGWFSVTPSSGNGSADLTINVAPNTTGAARQARFSAGTSTFLVGQDQ